MTKVQLIVDLMNMIGPDIEVDDRGLTTWLNYSFIQMADALTKFNPDIFTKTGLLDTAASKAKYEDPRLRCRGTPDSF